MSDLDWYHDREIERDAHTRREETHRRAVEWEQAVRGASFVALRCGGSDASVTRHLRAPCEQRNPEIGRAFTPNWLRDARQRCMALVDAAYSTLNTPDLWHGSSRDNTRLSGRRLANREHYRGNYGRHVVDGVTVGRWLS